MKKINSLVTVEVVFIDFPLPELLVDKGYQKKVMDCPVQPKYLNS